MMLINMFGMQNLRASLAFLSVATMLFMTGCSEKYQIEVSDLNSGSPLFEFKKSSMAPPVGKDSVVVRRIEVAEKLAGNTTSSVWRVTAPSEVGVEMKDARYGRVPAGFSEELKSQPLSPGKEYVIVVEGPGQFGVKSFSMPWKQ